jgi:Ala-tRNA(Pro) deacylase
MPLKTLKEYLDRNHIRYELIAHAPTFTSQETAASAHVPGRELAKTVIVRLDGRLAMAVLPATERLDLELLRTETGAAEARLADEDEFRGRFSECELGAMPPFGNLFDMDVYVENALEDDERIAFNAGTHSEIMRMRYEDFARAVKPTTVRMAASYVT